MKMFLVFAPFASWSIETFPSLAIRLALLYLGKEAWEPQIYVVLAEPLQANLVGNFSIHIASPVLQRSVEPLI